MSKIPVERGGDMNTRHPAWVPHMKLGRCLLHVILTFQHLPAAIFMHCLSQPDQSIVIVLTM